MDLATAGGVSATDLLGLAGSGSGSNSSPWPYIEALYNLGSGIENTYYNRKLQERIFEREDTRYQRAVKDLQAAGLSKTLAVGSGGSNAGAVVSSSSSQMDMLSRLQASEALEYQKAQTENLRVQTANLATDKKYKEAQIDNLEADTSNKQQSFELGEQQKLLNSIDYDTKVQALESAKLQYRIDLKKEGMADKEIDKLMAEIDQIKSNTAHINAMTDESKARLYKYFELVDKELEMKGIDVSMAQKELDYINTYGSKMGSVNGLHWLMVPVISVLLKNLGFDSIQDAMQAGIDMFKGMSNDTKIDIWGSQALNFN